MSDKQKIAVHLAVHNRLEYTAKCLRSLVDAAQPYWEIVIYIADSGDEDFRTYMSEVNAYIPYTYIKVSKDSYWAESMFACYEATPIQNFDFVLLLNNDVFLYENSVESLAVCAKNNPDSFIIGQLWDPVLKSHAYGGLIKTGFHPLHYQKAIATHTQMSVDSLQGNCVLIPREALSSGLYLDHRFRHNYADLELGIRARRLGFPLIVCADYVGECTIGERKPATNLIARIREFRSPKGTPLRSQIRILRAASSGKFWWIWLLPPLIRTITGKPPRFTRQ